MGALVVAAQAIAIGVGRLVLGMRGRRQNQLWAVCLGRSRVTGRLRLWCRIFDAAVSGRPVRATGVADAPRCAAAEQR